MKTTLIIILGRAIQVVISFLSLKIITNFLSKENVAYYFLFLSVMNYFGLALISPIGQYFNRKVHLWTEKNVLFERLFLHAAYVLLVSIISVPLMWAAVSYFGVLNGLDITQVCIAIGLAVFFNTMITTIVPTFNMLNYRVTFVIYSNLWLFLSLIFSIYIIKFFGESVLNWFYGQVLAQAIVFLIATYYLKKITKSTFKIKTIFSAIDRKSINSLSKFCIPLMISTLLMWVSTDSFRFVLERSYSLEYVGLFSVGFAISQRLSFALESIVQQVLYPTFYEKINSLKFSDRNNAWLEIAHVTVPLYAVLMVCTAISAPLLIRIFSGPGYGEASFFVITGAVFHFFRKITNLLALSAHSEMKTNILIGPYFMGAVASSVGVYYLSNNDFYRPALIVVMGSMGAFFLMIYNTRDTIKFEYKKDILVNFFRRNIRK